MGHLRERGNCSDDRKSVGHTVAQTAPTAGASQRGSASREHSNEGFEACLDGRADRAVGFRRRYHFDRHTCRVGDFLNGQGRSATRRHTRRPAKRFGPPNVRQRVQKTGLDMGKLPHNKYCCAPAATSLALDMGCDQPNVVMALATSCDALWDNNWMPKTPFALAIQPNSEVIC